MNWDDALGKIQPHIDGAPRAGAPSMGAGNIPYAPGATSFSPNTAPYRTQNQPAQDLPVNAGGRPPGQGGAPAPSAPAPGGQGGAQQIDPMTSLAYMQQLYDWFMSGRRKVQR